MITDLLEALTIFCFGLSWPISIRKSIVSRTAKGKSLFFEVFLLIGYACGIARKIIQVTDGSSGFLLRIKFFYSFYFQLCATVFAGDLFGSGPKAERRAAAQAFIADAGICHQIHLVTS